MCGIVGLITQHGVASEYVPQVNNALQVIAHRGPDAMDVRAFDQAILGHVRLSIIDVTEAANQPFTDVSGRYTLIFNGEIYNYRALRSELEQQGHSFKTSSDTEVLLYAYIQYGKKCTAKLNGFFAFAIYDREEKTLFVARDRYGIKPFLYYNGPEGFFFASELKGLGQLNIPKEIDYTSVYEYLQFNYIPSPGTIYKGIKKLEPGTQVEVKDGKVVFEQYYQVAQDTFKGTYEEAMNELKSRMQASVNARMVSDVPLGTFLSGGIDSSVISMLAAEQRNDLKTFSIGYADEPFFDETAYANEVAKKAGIQHTVFSLTGKDLLDHLPGMMHALDEPFADSSSLPVYILTKLTRQEVTVALSGDGADEIFAGYNKYMGEWAVQNAGWKGNMVSAITPLLSIFPKSRNSGFSNKIRQLEKFGRGKRLSKAERYLLWCKISDESKAINILSGDVQQQIAKDDYQSRKRALIKYMSPKSDINDVLRSDLQLVLQSDMLHKVDSMSMANALEVRVPFLDHNVVDFAMSLPESFKIKKGMKKMVLQDAYRGTLPDMLYNRPKHGFEVPLLKWLRTDLNSLINDDLLDDNFVQTQGVFNPDEVQALKKKLHSNNPEDSHARMWALMMFQSWWKRNL